MAYFSHFKTPGGLRCSSALPLHEVRARRGNLHICCNAEAERWWGSAGGGGATEELVFFWALKISSKLVK